MNHPGVNRIDGLILYYVLTAKLQGYNGIDRINFRANVKRFTHKRKKKNNIMLIVKQCKK